MNIQNQISGKYQFSGKKPYNSTNKKPYNSPRLICWGQLLLVTQGSSGNHNDQGSGNTAYRPHP